MARHPPAEAEAVCSRKVELHYRRLLSLLRLPGLWLFQCKSDDEPWFATRWLFCGGFLHGAKLWQADSGMSVCLQVSLCLCVSAWLCVSVSLRPWGHRVTRCQGVMCRQPMCRRNASLCKAASSGNVSSTSVSSQGVAAGQCVVRR